MTLDPDDAAYAGQAVYTRRALQAYDAIIFGFNCPVIWRCRKTNFIDLYNAHVSTRHLDIGVGTGLLLDRCKFPAPDPAITLMDMNPNSLHAAATRLKRYTPHTHQANVLKPWGLPTGSFESVGMCNLLHCLPGTLADKAIVFEHARAVLTPGGVVLGTTLLGKGVDHTRLAKRTLSATNRRGVMSNLDDSLEDLTAALARTFTSYDVDTVGSMALFSARTPLRG